MLDTLDELPNGDTKLVFIEPHTRRLRETLRARDEQRCTIIEKPVQEVDLSIFDALDRDDILFIDSTHVMKTASDVNVALFDILPRLKKDVVIHFHDIQYPFEYPDKWIFDRKYSWNEIYGVRAFLMYNDAFRIEFFNSLFVRRFRELIRTTYPAMLTAPGSGIWIRKLIG
jgi:hypothetical protein